jgi:riboflavin synthase alpha subunit
LTQIYIYTIIAFIIGFGLAWIIRTLAMEKIKKILKSTQGYLESETLKKETLQKENVQVHQMKQIVKLEQALQLNKMLDSDILLLQKSNEETEALLAKGQPAMHALKMQLIEANNTIARYKAQQQQTSK